mmetsp:Transcript_7317/g.22476  ORF Transcript_7317/g.22476 Transcript_7317/m.22476 type:complete len:212 (+) Transcript_7317:8261-8896(+)
MKRVMCVVNPREHAHDLLCVAASTSRGAVCAGHTVEGVPVATPAEGTLQTDHHCQLVERKVVGVLLTHRHHASVAPSLPTEERTAVARAKASLPLCENRVGDCFFGHRLTVDALREHEQEVAEEDRTVRFHRDVQGLDEFDGHLVAHLPLCDRIIETQRPIEATHKIRQHVDVNELSRFGIQNTPYFGIVEKILHLNLTFLFEVGAESKIL